MSSKGVTKRVVGRMSVRDLGDVPSVELSCAGDFHIGDALADEMMVREWVSWLIAEPNRYGLVAGDVMNMATRNSVSFQYGDMSPKEARERATRILAPAADRILGVVTGNHDYRAEKEIGISALEWTCTELGIRYFDFEAPLLLKVGCWANVSSNQPRMPISYSVYMAHGCRGGRKAGSKLNGVLDFREVIPNADLYVMGHGHDPMVKPDTAYMYDPRNGNIVEQEQMFVVCGSALERRIGSGYAGQKSYHPLAKVFPIVTLDGRRKHLSARVD